MSIATVKSEAPPGQDVPPTDHVLARLDFRRNTQQITNRERRDIARAWRREGEVAPIFRDAARAGVDVGRCHVATLLTTHWNWVHRPCT